MPKARQRIVVCDCLDCAEQPDFDTGLLLSAANEAAAKQDPPPKSLVICMSGAARICASREEGSSLDAMTCPHIKRVARDGGLGLLAFRSEEAARMPEAELTQLLGVYNDSDAGGAEPMTLQQRFQNMHAAYDSNLDAAAAVCTTAGMSHATILHGPADPAGSLLDPAVAAGNVLRHLGIQPAEQSPEASPPSEPASTPLDDPVDADLDLLLLHIDAASSCSLLTSQSSPSGDEQLYDAARSGLEWLDQLLKHLAAVPAVRETVLLVLVLTPAGQPIAPGALQPSKGRSLQAGKGVSSGGPGPRGPVVVRPVQSFEQLEGRAVEVALDAPAVVVRRLAGVIRRDRAEGVAVQEVLEKGVHGCILADRLLHEVAYKVAKAPKYGA